MLAFAIDAIAKKDSVSADALYRHSDTEWLSRRHGGSDSSAAKGSCRRRTSERLAAGASQVPASQNSSPVISLAPAKFLLKGLLFCLDLIETTVTLNRALGIIRQGLLSHPRAAERYMRSGRLRNCPEGQQTNRRSHKAVQKVKSMT